jgi:hypothetical protein
MRTDSAAFAAENTAAAKSPRLIVKIEYPSVDIYLSSHDDITGIPATYIPGVLIEPAISSQKLNPDEGRAEIGAASFSVADVDEVFSANIRGLYAAGYGLRDRQARFYLGYDGMVWSDFQLVGTQIIKDAKYDKGSYQIACNDVQRAARKEIFVLAETTIAQTVEDDDTTVNVATTVGFTTVVHGTSYTDAASSTVGYVKIKDEIIRYTGTTATSFTGCTRGVLGTLAARYVADDATPASRREKVTEYVYLELPGPKLVYALLTGVLHGDSATLPALWHLGISTNLVRLADFTDIGADLWDTAADANGVGLRFEGIIKTDGKAFVETECLRLLGLFMPVYADGTLGLRRMTRVLADAAAVLTLDESNSVSIDNLAYDMDSLHNAFQVLWNWNGKDYTRTTTFLDAASAFKHGRADTLELKYRGLYGGKHTDSLVFKLLDSVRDRYSAPPLRTTVEVFHSLNPIEVGDVVRVKYQQLRDFTGSGSSIDRSFEVQSVNVNHHTGAVTLDLFGSTARASVDSPTTSTTALPDAYYTAAGTNLASVMTITAGVVSGGPYTLTGGSDLTASGSIWYYSGDLTIPAGVTVNLTGNVQLRIKGYLTVNGTINGAGGGHAGVADNTSAITRLAGNAGYVGNSRGYDGLKVTRIKASHNTLAMRTAAPLVTTGKNPAFPYISLNVAGNALDGLPTDLRGTGGGPGGKVTWAGGYPPLFFASGGTGGNGGAGLCTVSRGFGVGANAVINLSGADTTTPAAYTVDAGKNASLFPGAGGAGGPGAYLLLLDGGLLSVPDLAGRLRCFTGAVGLPAYRQAMSDTSEAFYKAIDGPFIGYADPSVISAMDLSYSASRIQYVPAVQTATGDVTTIPPLNNLVVTAGTSGYSVTFAIPAGMPIGAIFEVWQYTAATPFSSATKVAEGATNNFFIPRHDTTTVYVWIRARYTVPFTPVVAYSATTPLGDGQAGGGASVSGMYATITPASIIKTAASSSITTATVTATLVGGTAATYAWTRLSGSTAISANSPSSAATTFTATGVGVGTTVSAVFRCTINSSDTADISVSCTNSVASLSATASPTTLSITGSATSLTTAASTVSPAGGTPSYSYAWARTSGSTAITITSPTAASTTFGATSLSAGESRTATFRCTVTDSLAATATVDVSVTITRIVISVILVPTSLYKEGKLTKLTTSSVTATPSGGTSPYTYAWTQLSGDAISCNSPSAATTTFVASALDVGEYRYATYRCTVTDATAATAAADLVVAIQHTDIIL